MKRLCYECKKPLKTPCYGINIIFRDPRKKYVVSKMSSMEIENRKYCKEDFIKISKKIKQIIKK